MQGFTKAGESAAFKRATRSWREAVKECPKIVENEDPEHVELAFRIGYHSGASDAWGRARWITVWIFLAQVAMLVLVKAVGI